MALLWIQLRTAIFYSDTEQKSEVGLRLNTIFISGCAALALAACKQDLAEISDEQLIALLGDGGEPAQITTKTRECAEVPGGITEAVYQDV